MNVTHDDGDDSEVVDSTKSKPFKWTFKSEPPVDLVERAHSAPLVFPRAWTCYDLKKCDHDHLAIVHAGDWELEICQKCGEAVHKQCEHKNNKWETEDKILRCQTCGMDVT